MRDEKGGSVRLCGRSARTVRWLPANSKTRLARPASAPRPNRGLTRDAGKGML